VRLWLVLWLTAVTAISLAPLKVKVFFGTVGTWHATGHLFVFLATGVLALSTARRAWSRGSRALLLVLFCAALEALQTVLYHNRFEWRHLALRFGCATWKCRSVRVSFLWRQSERLYTL